MEKSPDWGEEWSGSSKESENGHSWLRRKCRASQRKMLKVICFGMPLFFSLSLLSLWGQPCILERGTKFFLLLFPPAHRTQNSGTILGFTLRPYKMTYREVKYFSFPGELLMRMLQMLVLPLIVSSLVTGMAALDSKASGKMGLRAVVYYMTTTIIAVVIGIIIVIIIHPGKGSKENMHREGKIVQVTAADAFLDLIRNMFPPNLVEACFKQFKTSYEKRSFKVPVSPNETIIASVISNVSEAMETLTRIKEEMVPVPGAVNGVNALGLVVFSICFGLVIGNMKEQGQALKDFFDSLNEAIMRLVAVIMWYAPLGILFLIAGKIVEMEDMGVIGGQLAMYTITVIIGLLIHAVIVLPLLYFLVTRKNPWVFIGGLLQALITAVGTSSSSATLPITFKCLEENIGVDKRVTRFVLPVGATINMDGTALYEALAAIFIAQVNNFELNFGQIITISCAKREFIPGVKPPNILPNFGKGKKE
ncbi:excitatory amino acid transporter 1 isoform X4 [Petaurus breviceps papuanus]|uniref:excitatory amino acid transporter 1 isoform X4 n=1 Tax=Petaurus breviceps papuanus TaxID=3040969 RepID=UPI0036DD3B51